MALKYRCHLCNKWYGSRATLHFHEKINHGVNDQTRETVSSECSVSSEVTCSNGRSFLKFGILKGVPDYTKGPFRVMSKTKLKTLPANLAYRNGGETSALHFPSCTRNNHLVHPQCKINFTTVTSLQNTSNAIKSYQIPKNKETLFMGANDRNEVQSFVKRAGKEEKNKRKSTNTQDSKPIFKDDRSQLNELRTSPRRKEKTSTVGSVVRVSDCQEKIIKLEINPCTPTRKGRKGPTSLPTQSPATSLFRSPGNSKKSSSGRRTQSCPVCGQTGFMDQARYKNHMEIHEGIRPYLCPFCELAYKTDLKLLQHVSICHSQEPVSAKKYKSRRRLNNRQCS